MKLTIECECGNKVLLCSPAKKYLQLRDNLETKRFRYDGAEIQGERLKEIRISCEKCENWISLGVD